MEADAGSLCGSALALATRGVSMRFSIDIKPDAEGYTGRECPACEKYFKVKFGTGIPGATDCHCPYCNHFGAHDTFWTKQQIEYAQSVALNKVTGTLFSQMKRMERRPDPKAFISIGVTVKGSPTPIAYYSESELEERVKCVLCTLEYTIYGAFGFCPDCGSHNSLQIVKANLDLATKMLDLATSSSPEIRARLTENALEDAVSCFDGFGREHCSGLPHKVFFQNIDGARNKLLAETGFDLAANVCLEDWRFVCEQFRKRHLLAHKMGVVDSEYLSRTGAPEFMSGRKVQITEHDVRRLVSLLALMAENLYGSIAHS